MTQKVTYAIAAGMVAFMVVLLGALGAYIVVHGPAGQVAGTTSGIVAPQNGIATVSGSGSNSGSTYPVSSDQAVSIALSNVAGSSLLQAPRLVNFQGTAAYEVQLNISLLYVDATTGQVLYNSATDRQPRRGPRK